jgi:hypothetical protein
MKGLEAVLGVIRVLLEVVLRAVPVEVPPRISLLQSVANCTKVVQAVEGQEVNLEVVLEIGLEATLDIREVRPSCLWHY